MEGIPETTAKTEMTVRAVMVISLGGVQGAITATRPVEGIPGTTGKNEMTVRREMVISLGDEADGMVDVGRGRRK